MPSKEELKERYGDETVTLYKLKVKCNHCACPFCGGRGCKECEGTGHAVWWTRVKENPDPPHRHSGSLGCGGRNLEVLRTEEFEREKWKVKKGNT